MELTDATRGRAVIERWCVLAEQRLDYLAELYECGRWRRYFSETAFLHNIQEAKAAVETWRDLLDPAGQDIDPSWLGRNKSLLPRGIARPADRPAAEPIAPTHRPSFRFAETLPMPDAEAASLVPEPGPVPEPVVERPTEPPARLAIVAVNEPAPVADQEVAPERKTPSWQHALDAGLLEQRYPLLRKAG